MYALHQMNSTHTHPKLYKGNNPITFAPEGGRLIALAWVQAFSISNDDQESIQKVKAGGHLMIPNDETTTRGGHMLVMTHPLNGMIKPTQ